MGVLITKGMSLRIPKGGLRISLDGSQGPPVTVEVSLDMHPHWLALALHHESEAAVAHEQLIKAYKTADASGRDQALEDEFLASTVSIIAAAFAIDAFYASTKERTNIPAEIFETWKRKRTARYKQITETLQRSFTIRNEAVGEVQDRIKKLFVFRNWAVHPPADPRAPELHPDLNVGVDWRFVAFSSSNAHHATKFALSLISQCLDVPKPTNAELVEWATSASERIKPLTAEWTEHHGALRQV